MRVRSPSTTLTLTITVSPGSKSGIVLPAESFSSCSFSSCWMMFMNVSVGNAQAGPRNQAGFPGSGELLRHRRDLSPLRLTGLFGFSGPVLVGRPKVRAALAGQLLGLRRAARPRPWRGRRRSEQPELARSSKMCGRVYWGYSSSPPAKLSSVPDCSFPITPGISRTQASISDQRGDLAAGQHVVADRDLLERPRRDQPLVDPLEAAAQHHRAIAPGQRRRPGPASTARRAGSSAGEGGRRPAPRRSRAPARRPSSPCRGRRRPACRRRCGACRSAWERMSIVSSAHRPDASALPARLTPRGPGNISGKIVSTVARHMTVTRSAPAAPRRCAWP